jgi:hypothetical protein
MDATISKTLKAEELRIGNLIHFNGVDCEVTEIRTNELKENGWVGSVSVKRFISEKCYTYEAPWLAKCEPLPLTEEWLIKLGFYKDVTYQINLRERLYLTVDLPIKGSSRKSSDICITWDYTGRWVTGHILYVHQLQNLYFALTGKELVYGK